MDQYHSTQDIYKALVDDVPEDQDWLLGLVAFAVIEEQKVEWIKHQTLHNGGYPSDEAIRAWYSQLPSGALLRARDTAQTRLTDYGASVIETYLADYGEEMQRGILVNEIREIGKFWPQFGVNVAGGFASALLFAALLGLLAFLVFNDTSAVDLVKKSKTSTIEVTEHGEE